MLSEKVSIFNETILNALRNYIPDKTLTCDDKDPPCLTIELNLFRRIKISLTNTSKGVTLMLN